MDRYRIRHPGYASLARDLGAILDGRDLFIAHPEAGSAAQKVALVLVGPHGREVTLVAQVKQAMAGVGAQIHFPLLDPQVALDLDEWLTTTQSRVEGDRDPLPPRAEPMDPIEEGMLAATPEVSVDYAPRTPLPSAARFSAAGLSLEPTADNDWRAGTTPASTTATTADAVLEAAMVDVTTPAVAPATTRPAAAGVAIAPPPRLDYSIEDSDEDHAGALDDGAYDPADPPTPTAGGILASMPGDAAGGLEDTLPPPRRVRGGGDAPRRAPSAPMRAPGAPPPPAQRAPGAPPGAGRGVLDFTPVPDPDFDKLLDTPGSGAFKVETVAAARAAPDTGAADDALTPPLAGARPGAGDPAGGAAGDFDVEVQTPESGVPLDVAKAAGLTTGGAVPDETFDASTVTVPQLARLTPPQKMQAGLHGTRDVRIALLRDPNRSLHVWVLKNPRISKDEIALAARMNELGPDALVLIAANRDWMSIPGVASSLARNPKTPLTLAVDLVAKIPMEDARSIAKSGSARQPVVAAARKRVNG